MVHKFLMSLMATLIVALPASAQSVDEILAKYYQARGGLEKIKTVKALRFTGKISGGGMEFPAVMEQKRPNSMRMEFTFQGLTGIQAYDGKTGWMVMPFSGKKDPEPMGEDALKEVSQQADIDGPLVDYKEKGHTVELVGKESVEGTDAYKLKLTRKNGDVDYVYLDADSYIEIKSEGKRTVRGTEFEGETIYGDYKEVNGLMLPHSLESGAKGGSQKQKITIEKIEINPTIEDSRFVMPEVKKPEAKPETKPETKPEK
jgi:outer membrane lipoprotein-sorting protein